MVGIEQALPRAFTLEVDYNANRGLHEMLSIFKNLPDRVTGVVPRSTWSSFNYFAPIDRSKYAGLQVTLKRRFKRNVFFSAAYAWAKSHSFGDADLLNPIQPQDPNNIKSDWGPTPFDIRSRFVANGLWEIPLDRWMGLKNPAAKLLAGGWQVSGILSAQTGTPVNVRNTASGYPTDRPDASGAAPYLSDYQSGLHQYLNPAAFVTVPLGSASNAQIRPGNLERYGLYSPGLVNLDASLAKTFSFREKVRLQLRADTFNTLNHTNLAGLVATINSGSSFGRLTTATPRTMQVGARLTF